MRFRFTYHFLDHVHDLLLDQIEALCVTSRSTTDHVVHFDIIVLLANASAIHGVGELNEDRVLFHDALNVLASDANNALVVLIRYMEGNRSWHFLFNKVEAVLRCLVLAPAYVNAEVVLVEAVEDDLYVA